MGLHLATGQKVERVYPGSAIWAPNTTVPFTLDVNSVVEALHFKLTGTLTLASYSTAPTLRKEGIENLISLVSFTGAAKQSGNQAVNLSAVDPNYLRLKTQLINGTAPPRVDVGTANGTYNFETNFTKFFGAKRSKVGDATFLDTRKLQNLRVNFATRDVTALVFGGVGGTATLSNVQITVSTDEWQGGATQTHNPYIRETFRQWDVTSISGLDRTMIPGMPISNRIVRQTIKGTVGNVDYADPSDAFFTTALRTEGAHIKSIIKGKGGSFQRLDTTYAHQQTQDKNRFKLESWPVGYAVIEYSPTGNVKDMLDMRGIISGDNLFDLTPVGSNINTIRIYDEELVAQ